MSRITIKDCYAYLPRFAAMLGIPEDLLHLTSSYEWWTLAVYSVNELGEKTTAIDTSLYTGKPRELIEFMRGVCTSIYYAQKRKDSFELYRSKHPIGV